MKHRVATVVWVPLQPLEGYTVGVTADRRAGEQAGLLRDQGARVLDGPALALVRAVLERRVHAVTFVSTTAVRNLFAVADEDGAADDLRTAMNTKTVVACADTACADSARAVGIDEPLAPDDVGLLGSMVRLLSERLRAGRAVLDLGGTPVEVQGQAMLVGEEHVQLTRREAGVFNVLAARNGFVVSPTTLLRTVWGSAAGDEHVVGVTIGRLRRKLGGSGSSVRTVPRRGYRLDVTSRPSPEPASK